MFIQHYLSKVGNNDSLEKVLDEVKHFTLASHLFWVAWSLFNGKVSKIRFGYWVRLFVLNSLIIVMIKIRINWRSFRISFH